MLELPCVYEVNSKCGRGHFGVPVVARNGDKNQPRYALLQPPIEEVTTTHNGVKYVHTNLVAIWAVKCQRNRVKVMTRFQDNPKNPYMSYLEDIRVYQDPNTRTPDLPVLGGKKWKCGYVNDGFNASLQGKPAPCRSWTEFAESASLTTNDCGDFQMHTDTDSYQWVPCELDVLRIGSDINMVVEMDNDEAVRTWGRVQAELAYLHGTLGPHGISCNKVLVYLYIYTCTAGQLGETIAFLRRADQWSDALREKLNPPDVFRELHNALLGKKNNRKKTPVS